MVQSKMIVPKCLVACAVMEHYIKAGQGQDAMACQKAVEEAELLATGDEILEDPEGGEPCERDGVVHPGECKTTTKSDGTRNCKVAFLNGYCPGSQTFKCCNP